MSKPILYPRRKKVSKVCILTAANLFALMSLTVPTRLTPNAAAMAASSTSGISGVQVASPVSQSKPPAAVVSPFSLAKTTFIIDGVQLQALAFSADGTLMVELMPIARAMGYTVDYRADTGDLTLSKPRRVLELILYNSGYSVNGLTSSAKTPFVRNNSTYVPLRQLSNLSGYTIAIQDKNTYILTSRPENELTISASDELAVTTEPYSFKINYPVLSGWHNSEAMNKVNLFLRDTVEGWKTQAEQELKQAWAAHPNKDKIIDYAHILPYGFQVKWTVASNENGLLSLYADTYQYMGESRQDKSVRYSWTFDLATGEELTLQQAAGNNPDYRTRINQRINLRIASGEAENFSTINFQGVETADTGWYLQDGVIVVYVQQPSADVGNQKIPEIRIPLSAVK